jgi:AP-2 complex subunit alpha
MHLPRISDTMKCIGAYVLSEYAETLSSQQPQYIFDLLNKHFTNGTPKVKAMMLTAFAKLAVKFPDLKDQVQMICLISS